LVLIAGANVIRFAPALNITDAEIREAMDKFKNAIKTVTLK